MSQWNLIAGLKKFDAYPKTLEDFRIQTRSGKEPTLSWASTGGQKVLLNPIDFRHPNFFKF